MPERQKRILCVENDKDTCQLLNHLLTSQGYEVMGADSIEECFNLAEKYPFDLFVLDYWYEEITGVDICKQLHQKYTTPIVFFSGEARGGIKQEALETCADAYITKPNIDILIQTVHEVIGNAQ